MAKKEKSQKETKTQKKTGSRVTLIMIVSSLLIIAIFKTGFIFLVVALLPAIVASYVDSTPSRSRFHTVVACNLSGVVPYMAQILQDNGTRGGYVTELMSDASTWFIIYAWAGFGWVLVYTTPILAKALITLLNQGKLAHYQSVKDRMVHEWGPEVANPFAEDKNKMD